jgi:hypothetical protein
MRSIQSSVATASVGLLLALMAQAGALPLLSCLGCETSRMMVDSYQSVTRVYERARTWSSIARIWIDPQASAPAR